MSLVTNLQSLITDIGTQFKNIKTMISGTATGNVSALTTTATNLVGAINEVKATAGNAVTSVNGVAGPGAITVATTDVAEGTNLYFTTARAIASPLTGFAAAAGTITAADSILQGIQKVQGNLSALTTAGVTESGNLYFTNARAIAAPLTGYTSGAGTVAATDTVLQAIQKLNGNAAALINDTTPSSTTVYSSNKTDAQIATAVSNLVAASPAALDTLNELANALGNDASFATTTATAIGLKANSADVFTKVEIGTDAVTHNFAADFAAAIA